MNVNFVSGHGNLTIEEWLLYYKPMIDNALLNNEKFIMGDFRGCDVITMEYLKDKTPNVVICHCKEKPRYLPRSQAPAWECLPSKLCLPSLNQIPPA